MVSHPVNHHDASAYARCAGYTPHVVHQLVVNMKRFWKRALAERLIGFVLAAFMAFWMFILGLVVLFDRVGATSGYSTRAWVVSITGLVICLLLGVACGANLLRVFTRLSQWSGGSTARFAAAALARTVAALVLPRCRTGFRAPGAAST